MTNYNIRSAYNRAWCPQDFECSSFGRELDKAIKSFQKENRLKADGFAGPKTIKVLKSLSPKENSIVCGLERIPIPKRTKVILWTEEEGYKAKEGSYRPVYKKRTINMMVNHWDACKSSKDAIRVLNSRNLSAQYLIDENGDIYETMNDNYIGYHCGNLNRYTIGVEICNPYYIKHQSKTNPRRIVKNKYVHGKKMRDHLDFHDVQIQSLMDLWVAINKGHEIPIQTPTKDGKEVGTIYAPAMNNQYRGQVHHYNLSRGKIDCGGLDLVDLVEKIKKTQ